MAAIVWGITFTAVGYAFGHSFEKLLHRLAPSPITIAVIVAVLVVIGTAVWLVRRGRHRGAAVGAPPEQDA